MGREVRRVPLDFDHQQGEVWPGFLLPDSLHEPRCPDCKNGYSPFAQALQDLWYGYLPFHPAITGSPALTADTPVVRRRADRNIDQAPDYYLRGAEPSLAVMEEARRLADLWNSMWSHHLTQGDVDALVAAGRLRDFTHRWDREARRSIELDPRPAVTAAQVNEWSLTAMGHDAINCAVVVRARCEAAGQPVTCSTCEGHATVEAYPGQRAAADAWEPTDPPTGEGWQMWETVSEGSPVSPVFADADGLISWLCTDYVPVGGGRHTPETARAFVTAGWAPSLIVSAATGPVAGELAL